MRVAKSFKPGAFYRTFVSNSTSKMDPPNSSLSMCSCLSGLQKACSGSNTYRGSSGKLLQGFNPNTPIDRFSYNSELGRMMYTISILLMFALVILLLMVRSIRRSNATVEVESLLESMRFREELDLQQRQKRRLQKAKNKVSAWLSRAGAKTDPRQSAFNANKVLKKTDDTNRTNSLQSANSYLPEIVISKSDEGSSPCPLNRQNSYTPSLSLIYDFDTANAASNGWSRKGSAASTCSGSDVSDLTFNSSIDFANNDLTSHDDEVLTSSILYESLGSESDLESISYGRSASIDVGKVANIHIQTPLALQPSQSSAHPTPTPTSSTTPHGGATPVAPNQQRFFPGTTPELARTGSVRSLQLKPNYYTNYMLTAQSPSPSPHNPSPN